MASEAATRSFREKHRALYSSERECARYDAEICRNQGVAALLAAIEAVHPLQPHFHVVDAGCGTGKLARLIAPRVSRVSAFDRAADCLAVAREAAPPNVTYAEADLRRLPVADGCADVACAGWALSYLKAEHEEWYADGSYGGAWRDEVDAALGELDRALADGGVAVVFETQGTATEAPRRLAISTSVGSASSRACNFALPRGECASSATPRERQRLTSALSWLYGCTSCSTTAGGIRASRNRNSSWSARTFESPTVRVRPASTRFSIAR